MLLLETTTVIKETMDEYRDFGELIRRLMHPGIFENLIFKIFIRRKSRLHKIQCENITEKYP